MLSWNTIIDNEGYPVNDISSYILVRCLKKKKPITNIQLQKILYYAQIEYYKLTQTFLFKDDFVASRFGPIIKEIYYKYNINCAYEIRDIYNTDIKLPKNIKSFLNKIIQKKIKLDMWTIVKDIHRENGAWYITYDKGKGNNKIIEKSLIIEREIQNKEEKYEKNNRRNNKKEQRWVDKLSRYVRRN